MSKIYFILTVYPESNRGANPNKLLGLHSQALYTLF